MAEAVKATIGKPDFAVSGRKTLGQRSQDIADQNAADGIGFHPTAPRPVKDKRPGFRQRFQHGE